MRVFAVAALAVTLATTSIAKQPLREIQHINDGLLAVGLADEIRKNCGSISGRIFRGIGRLRSIHQSAVEMGYTSEQIDTFRKDRKEKNRLKARGQAYLAANGASLSKPETMCELGRKEIAKNSPIGTLLKAN